MIHQGIKRGVILPIFSDRPISRRRVWPQRIVDTAGRPARAGRIDIINPRLSLRCLELWLVGPRHNQELQLKNNQGKNVGEALHPGNTRVLVSLVGPLFEASLAWSTKTLRFSGASLDWEDPGTPKLDQFVAGNPKPWSFSKFWYWMVLNGTYKNNIKPTWWTGFWLLGQVSDHGWNILEQGKPQLISGRHIYRWSLRL